MSYAAVDTIVQGTRTAGDTQGQVTIGLLKQAAVRVLVVGATESKESSICRAILEGRAPTTYVAMVLEAMDIAGNLATHTDAQVDSAILTAWTYFLAARQLG